MRNRCKSTSELDEAGIPFTRHADLAELVSDAVARAREHAAAQRNRIEVVRARTERARRVAGEKRRTGLAKWSLARSALFEAVAAIDRAIGADGMAMSVSDEPAHPTYLAAAQVRASLLGRAMSAVLEIIVTDDLRLLAKVEYSDSSAPTIRLPAVAKVTARDFGMAIVAYLECALPQAEAEVVRVCERCGCFLPI